MSFSFAVVDKPVFMQARSSKYLELIDQIKNLGEGKALEIKMEDVKKVNSFRSSLSLASSKTDLKFKTRWQNGILYIWKVA